MNIIFATSGVFALFYLDLLELLLEKIPLDKVGFYVTGRSNYYKYLEKANALNMRINFLKEWELTSFGKNKEIDLEYLSNLEKKFGEPFLWDALMIDRRIYNGLLTKYKQDYKPRFTHKEMLFILQKGFKAILKFIEEIRPDIIVGGFTPATFGEYIFYLCAKKKGIKYINLNPTKIQNYVTFSEEIYREFPHFEKDYNMYLEIQNEDTFVKKSKDYLSSRDKRYEGVILSKKGFPLKQWITSCAKWPYLLIRYYSKRDYLDNHVKGKHIGYFFNNIYDPIKDKIFSRFITYISPEKLKNFKYVYYPLHVEPEIALSLFGRQYLNQIELIRNIALAIPVTWKLIIKDHPAGVGRRNIGYYKRLLEIPNVKIVNHYVESSYLIQHSQMVFTVSGFSGFEGAIAKKPIITFGKCFYNILPSCMVRNIKSLEILCEEIKNLLNNYTYKERAIVALVAAIIKNSISINLYTEILKKKGRLALESKTLGNQNKEFVGYLLKWI